MVQVDYCTPLKEDMEVCIGAKDNKVLSLKSSALKLGEIDVKVEAKIDNSIKNCKSVEEGNGYTDTLAKQLRVKPEVVPVEKVNFDFKCFESGKEGFKLSKLEVQRVKLFFGFCKEKLL